MFLSWLMVYCVVAPLMGATIKGNVVYKGKVPGVLKKAIKLNEECRGVHDADIFPEFLVLGEDGQSVQNVIVFVKSGLAEKKYEVKSGEVVIDQKGCQYIPHVVAVQVGQGLKILNSDGKTHNIMHNVNGKPKQNNIFNLSMTKSKVEINRVFKKAEAQPFPLMCNVHPWMKAWVGVFEHPFFSVTDEEGRFSIEDLPKGSYEIEIWHEKLESVIKKVEVTSEDQVIELEEELSQLKRKSRKKRKK